MTTHKHYVCGLFFFIIFGCDFFFYHHYHLKGVGCCERERAEDGQTERLANFVLSAGALMMELED